MEWNAIFELIDPSLIIVLAVCWVLGYILKQTPRVPNWTIIYVVTIVSIVLTIWILGWGPESLIQGVLTGAVAIYGNQFVKQGSKGIAQKVGDQK